MHWDRRAVAKVLRVPGSRDDKFSRGAVGLRTGSPQFPGAAVLSVEGAWRTGPGLVLWLGDPVVASLVLSRRPETLVSPRRVDAWVVGSGTDPRSRSDEETDEIRRILAGSAPVVVDAGALDLVDRPTAPAVITPHAGEFARLQDRLELPLSGSREAQVVAMAERTGAVVLLKGSETLVATPEGGIVTVSSGCGWLATAGAGDVLAGMIGALVVQTPGQLASAVASAAWLHGRAACLAAGVSEEHPGRPITALEVADAVSRAITEVLDPSAAVAG